MFVRERRNLTVDDQVQELGADLQRVSIGHNEVGDLPSLNRTQAISNTEDLGVVDCDSTDCFFARKPI
jgi:hypothetical protein